MANTSFKGTIGINSTPEIFNSFCSCLDCDTSSCFTHRREQKECACSNCRAPQACVLYTKAVEPNDSQHDINTENIPEKQVKDDGLNESLTEETNYEDGRKNYLKKAEKDMNNLEKFKNSKKNTHMRSMSLTYSRPDINPGAAKLSAQVMNVPYEDFKESLSYNQVEPYQSSLTKYDIFRRIKEAYDACSCKVCECIGTKSLHVKNELCKCKPCDCQNCSSYLTKMEFPERFKLSHRCAKLESKKPKSPTEADVCDCKPCDCIQCTDGISKPCACEPCQCIECKKLSIHQPRTLVVAPVGEEHIYNTCLCSPCDCVQCGNFGVPSHLMHEMSTGINRHPLCHCEACVDNTCEPDGTDICKCERQRKVMRKPVERDSHDYDIRRVMIGDSSDQPDDNDKTKHNTIAMFAAMASTFPRFQQSHKQMTQNAKHECKCEECECIACDCKEKDSTLSAQTPKQTLKTQLKIKTASCNCEPCECLVCSNYKQNRLKEKLHSLERSVDCRCDVCCCLNCKSAQMSKTKDYQYNKTPRKLPSNACSCKQCDCPDCRDMSNKWNGSICHYAVKECKHCSRKYVASNESLYPIKKGERFTPSIYNTKVNNSLATISKSSSIYNSFKQKSTSRILREQLRGDTSIYHTFSECDYIDRYLNGQSIKLKAGALSGDQTQNTHPFCNQSSNKNNFRNLTKLDILKCEAYTQFDDPCKPISKVDYAPSGSYHSEYFSYDSTSKTSDTKENSMTPISGTRNKSWESSCNSSGHDNPGYLVSFPKSAEVGVRVAMQLNMDKDLNLERINNALKKINTYNGIKAVSQIIEIDGTSNTKDILKESEMKSHYIPSSKNLGATRNNLNIDLVKQIKSGNASMRNYFQNITNHSLYPIPNVPYEPVETIIDNLSCSENTAFEKQLIKSKYGTSDSRNNKRQAEIMNLKAANVVSCMDDDYKRVQNTLKEAKAFSFKLLQILEKYEKANREFVSISQRLKKSHESIINKSNTKDVDLLKMDKGDGQIGSQTPDPHDKPEHETLLDEEDRLIDVDQPVLEDTLTKNGLSDDKAHVHYNDKDLLAFAMTLQNNSIEVDVNRRMEFVHIFQSKDKEITQTRYSNYGKTKPKIVESPTKDLKTDLQNNYDIITDNGSSKYKTRTRCSQQNSISKVGEGSIKKRYKKYNRLLRRTIIVSRKVNLNCVVEPKLVTKACVSTEISKTLISQADKEVTSEIGNLLQLEVKELEEINSIAKRLNVVFGSTDEISASTSADDTEITCKISDVTDTIKVDQSSTTVLKKNLSLNTTPCTRNKGVCIFPSLEVEIKEAVHSISLQTCAVRGTRQNLNYENNALVELQVEVNKLLNMPLLSLDTHMDLPPFLSAQSSPESPFQAELDSYEEEVMNMKSSQTHHHKKQLVDANISCNRQPQSHVYGGYIKANGESNEPDIKCSCEALKVGALGVRKVSDHTVLVKWNAPRFTHDVHGYELLVDGRPVQKILSPTRCMAVVTCLPHSDKMLITIRTITMTRRTAHDTRHIPSTTVVYRRRAKF